MNNLFIEKGLWKRGTFVAEYDTMLTGIQMRRPGIAYLTKEQVANTKKEIDEIPKFVIEVISTTDNHYKLADKISEYYKYGV